MPLFPEDPFGGEPRFTAFQNGRILPVEFLIEEEVILIYERYAFRRVGPLP